MAYKIFFFEKLRKVPFYLRLFKVDKPTDDDYLSLSLRDTGNSLIKEFPYYNSNATICKRPSKPISKILSYEEQRLF